MTGEIIGRPTTTASAWYPPLTRALIYVLHCNSCGGVRRWTAPVGEHYRIPLVCSHCGEPRARLHRIIDPGHLRLVT